VLLDEVLAGLTTAEIDHAISLIRKIRGQGTTVLFIEHNMRTVLELTERLFVLNYGKVIAHGSPRDVMRQPGPLAQRTSASWALPSFRRAVGCSSV
jgi:branched-chain amino acid transport system permease protein